MSDSRAIDVANAAVALLNAASGANAFTPFTFTAKRVYRPTYDLVDVKAGNLILVMPQALDTSPMLRRQVQELVSIDVAFFGWVDPTNELVECDAYMHLIEQLKETLEAPTALVLADAPTDCGWQGTTNDPIFDQDDLTNDSVFHSPITLTYLTRRNR
jgi:hypothetical protein